MAVVELAGEHDLGTKDAFESLLVRQFEMNELAVIDVSRAVFVDMPTIDVLVHVSEVANRRRRRLGLQAATAPIVRRALELSGVRAAVQTVSGRDEALRPLEPGT